MRTFAVRHASGYAIPAHSHDWHQLRLLHALKLLAARRPVTAIAIEVGYDSPSAFIAMFKRTLGTTPHRYFESNKGSGGLT